MRFFLGNDVLVNRNFWIGWVQVTNGFLNVGFDRNYNDVGWVQESNGSWKQDLNQRNLWYRISGSDWAKDINEGTLMIRPVMGKRKELQTFVEQPETSMGFRMKIYPNPASQYVYIGLETLEPAVSQDYTIEIYDVTGRLHYHAPYTGNYIDVSGFDQGLYLVRLVNKKMWNTQTDRLLIIK